VRSSVTEDLRCNLSFEDRFRRLYGTLYKGVRQSNPMLRIYTRCLGFTITYFKILTLYTKNRNYTRGRLANKNYNFTSLLSPSFYLKSPKDFSFKVCYQNSVKKKLRQIKYFAIFANSEYILAVKL